MNSEGKKRDVNLQFFLQLWIKSLNC